MPGALCLSHRDDLHGHVATDPFDLALWLPAELDPVVEQVHEFLGTEQLARLGEISERLARLTAGP